MSILIGCMFISLTVLLFMGLRILYERIRLPLLIPVATTTLVIIAVLFLSEISYETYMLGGRWIQELLGPAVVALAYPLYHQRDKIVRYRYPLSVGILTGIFIGISSGIIYVRIAALPVIYASSFLPKSVTSPIARAIIGKRKGDSVEVMTPGGGKSYEIVRIRYK
jgi:putative effector of murein hydrolase